MSDQGRSKRIEFTSEVKQIIWRRAGGLCSVCLEPVFGTDNNFSSIETPQRSTSIGEAAHIYSASENGPRGNSGFTAEFLGSAENGISTCRNCHANIDGVESKYSSDDLLDMKKVRELSQDIARHIPGVAYYIPRVGTCELDKFVREAPNRDDHQAIADSFIIYAELAKPLLGALKKYCGCSMPRPTDFAMLPLLKAILDNVEAKEFIFERVPIGPLVDVNYADLPRNEEGLIARTLDLSEAWASGRENIRFSDDKVVCEFFTKDPITGEPGRAERFTVIAGVWRAYSPERGLFHGIEVRRFESRAVGLDWKMHAMVRSDGHTLHSSLSLKKFACPDSSEDKNNSEIFKGYLRILKEIRAGRLPYARLAMLGAGAKDLANEPREKHVMHPLEFSMSVDASQELIKSVVDIAERISMGDKVADEIGSEIIYRKSRYSAVTVRDELNPSLLGFFNHGLTEDMIRAVLIEFKQQVSKGVKVAPKSIFCFDKHGLPYRIQAFHNEGKTRFVELAC
ncbi:MAG: hypothetical protein ACN6PW_02850 [Pseudomonas kermanshahensis]|uniref:hypothetical protein n=1 Tax=Pseudomonas kermanshahensis TaxID=2745482 RepID=UPI003D109520